jgi:hypothetical protein
MLRGRKAETVDQRLVQVRSYSRSPEVDSFDAGRLRLTVDIVCDIWAPEWRMDGVLPKLNCTSRNCPLLTVSANDPPTHGTNTFHR